MHFYKMNANILVWREKLRVKIETKLQVIAGKVPVESRKTKKSEN